MRKPAPAAVARPPKSVVLLPRRRTPAADRLREPRRVDSHASPGPAVLYTSRSLGSGLDICQYRCMSKSRLPLSDVSACRYAPMVREPLSPDAAVDIAAKLKALADPVRLRLFSLVASHSGGEACVCEISGDIDVSQPTISHH